MAPRATIYHFIVGLSDVDRSIYEKLDFRVARHPSESIRYMLTRTLAYCLSYDPGIAFSKGGVSSVDEPPVAIRDPHGALLTWIEIGAPAAERLHHAAKAARQVLIYTHVELELLRKEAATRPIHRREFIDVYRFEPGFLDALADQAAPKLCLELTRNDDRIYVDIAGATLETTLPRSSLLAG